jgi:hypothetical protein
MNSYLIDINRKTAPKQLTKKALNEIEKRQLYALRLNNYNDIMDAKEKVIKIIDEEGLNNEESKVKLETALKVLEYIIPKKKSTESVITVRKLEDIIQDHIQEAEIISEKPEDNEKI